MICHKCGKEYEDDMPKCLWCDAPNEEAAAPGTTEESGNRVAGLFMWSCMIFNFTQRGTHTTNLIVL